MGKQAGIDEMLLWRYLRCHKNWSNKTIHFDYFYLMCPQHTTLLYNKDLTTVRRYKCSFI